MKFKIEGVFYRFVFAGICLQAPVVPSDLAEVALKNLPKQKVETWVPVIRVPVAAIEGTRSEEALKKYWNPSREWSSIHRDEQGHRTFFFWRKEKDWSMRVGYPMVQTSQNLGSRLAEVEKKPGGLKPFAIVEVESPLPPSSPLIWLLREQGACLKPRVEGELLHSLKKVGESLQAEMSIADNPQTCTPVGVAPPMTGPGFSSDHLCCKGAQIIPSKEGCADKSPRSGFWGICAACGDKVCDKKYEDTCNCPADCAK